MGNAAYSIGVETDSIAYKAGSDVTGRIYLSVNNRGGLRASALMLTFSGLEYALKSQLLVSATSQQKLPIQASHSIIQKAMPITKFPNRKIKQGHYEFPFQFQLPSNLPSSMSCLAERGSCAIHYQLEGSLTQISSSVEKDSRVCAVRIAGGLPPPTTDRNLIIPTKQKGQASVTGVVETGNGDGLRPGEDFNVIVKYSNHTKLSRVVGVKVLLKEKIVWKGNRAKKTVLVEKYIRTKAQEARQFIQIQVPKMVHETFNGQLIVVTHKVSVHLDFGMPFLSPLKSRTLVAILKAPRHSDVHPTAIAELVGVQPSTMSPAEAVVPLNWSPQTSERVVVPFAEAVCLDKQEQVRVRPRAYSKIEKSMNQNRQ